MKLTILGISCLVLTSLIFGCNNNSKNPQKKSPVTDGVTLNGVQHDIADSLVASFVDDNTSSDFRTNIWLSKPWVTSVYQILSDEQKNNVGTDGFRIYFAKRLDAGTGKMRNTIVIVSTKNDGDDPHAESGEDHLDYYEHTSDFLQRPNSDASLNEDWVGSSGATLYSDSTCTGDNCSVNTINFIRCKDAYKAVQNFGKQTINTYSEWFPIELLEYLRDQLNDPLNKYADGIRIYFAKNKAKKNRHSLIFVTTQNIGTPRQDNYACYGQKLTEKYHHYNRMVGSNDNGEQCPNNCAVTTLP